MNVKTRITKLERVVKPQKMTWKEFINLDKIPADMQAGWQKFIQRDCSDEHKKPTG